MSKRRKYSRYAPEGNKGGEEVSKSEVSTPEPQETPQEASTVGEDRSTTVEEKAPQKASTEPEEAKSEEVVEELAGEEEVEDVIQTAREQFSFTKEWSDEDVANWLEVCSEDRSPFIGKDSDVLSFDPTRPARAPKDWNTSELLAFLRDELKGFKPSESQVANLVEEYRRREEVESAWSNEEILAYHRQGVTPKKTSTGVWVNDRSRNSRAASSWSNAELEAWAMGEIKPQGKADAVQLAQTLKERLSLTPAGSSVEEILAAYRVGRDRNTAVATANTLNSSGTLSKMNEAYIADTLERYIKAMRPGQVVGETQGGRAQRSLDAVFAYTLRLEGPKLKSGLDLIKRTVKDNRNGAFSTSHAFRFVHLLKGDAKSRRRHTNFIRLFQICTDPSKGVKSQTDIPSMLADHPDSIRPLLIDYFQNHC